MELNYEFDTAIDPDDLVEEWLKLPSTYFAYQKELAKEEKRVKDVWEDLKVTRSKLVGEAREEGGAKNATEIEAYYRQHDDHKKAKKELIDAEYSRDLVKAAVSSFYRKETAMLEVGKLIGRIEHFRHPNESVDIKEGKRLHDKAMGLASDKQRDLLNKDRKPRRRRRK